jgi:hypothetical protein
MRLLLFPVLLAIIQAVPQTATATPQVHVDTKKSSAMPSREAPASLQKPANPNSDQDQNKEQSIKVHELPSVSVARDRFDWIVLFSTLALVIIGAIGVIAAFRTLEGLKTQTGHIARQALSMRRQTTHLKNSVIAAKDGVEAALLNARAVIDSERPWIEIELGPIESEPLGKTESTLFNCSIRIKNHGRTVALIESVHIGFDSLNTQFPVGQPLDGVTRNFYSLLGSGQTVAVGSFDADSLPDWHSILNGTKRGFLQVIVKYRDVLKGIVIHETSVVYIFQNSLEDPPERVSVLNVYS